MAKILFLFVLSVCVLATGAAAADGDEIKLGDICVLDDDCDSISNSICDSSECECDDGYVASSNNSLCLPLAMSLGDDCEVKEQCSNFPSAECVDKTCVVAQAIDIPTTTAKPKEACKQDSDCPSFLVKTVCKDGVCVLAVPSVPELTKSVFILNGPCVNDSDCTAEGAACTNNVCKCKDGFVPSLNLKECLEKAKSVGEKCVENVQCLHLDASICDNGKCGKIIPKFFSNSDEKGGPLLIGSSCQTNAECKHLSHAECRENVCQCTQNFVTSVSSNACLEKAKKEGDPCKIDKQCEDIKQATCLLEKCVKPGVVGTKLGKQNSGSRTGGLLKLILGAILFIKMFSV